MDVFELAVALDVSKAAPGVSTIVAGFREVVAAISQAKKEANEFAGKTTSMRESLRDIASVRGMSGVSDQMLKEHLDLMRSSGLNAGAAHRFQEQFLGEAEAFRGKFDPKTFSTVQTKAAQLSQVTGDSQGAVAKLAGRILASSKEGTGADEIMRQVGESLRIVESGSGRADLVMSSVIEAGSTLIQPGGAGRVKDWRTLSALGMGASRITGEGSVDTKLTNFASAVQGQVANKNWRNFVSQEIGTKEGTKVEDAMGPMFEWMEKQQAAGRDLNNVLMERGLMLKQGREAFIGMFGQRESIQKELRGEVKGPGVDERISEYQGKETGKKALSKARATAAEVETGERFEVFERFREQAYTELLESGKIGPEATQGMVLERFMAKATGDDPIKKMIDQRAMEIGAKEKGIAMTPDSPNWFGRRQAGALMAGIDLKHGLEDPLGELTTGKHTAAQQAEREQIQKRVYRQIAKQQEDASSWTGWIGKQLGGAAPVDTMEFIGKLNAEQSARGLGDFSGATAVGPDGRAVTAEQFAMDRKMEGRSADEIKRLTDIFAARIQAQQQTPALVPDAGKQLER